MKKPEKPKKVRLVRGCEVQLWWEDWKYGPGKVLGFTQNGAARVKWPRKGRVTIHNRLGLRRVEK